MNARPWARETSRKEKRTFIPPFDDPKVIQGQGTVGMEILRQIPGDLDIIFVPIGGGGLIAGIAAYVKQLRPEIKIIGVEPCGANAMAQSLNYGERVMLSSVDKFADGVAVKTVGVETFRLCRALVDGVVLVRNSEICAAVQDVFSATRTLVEPSGALSLAGLKAYTEYYGLKNKTMCAVISGANVNFDRLRVISDLANMGQKQEAVLATVIPEAPGSFLAFCKCLGAANISEFRYTCHNLNDERANVMYGLTVQSKEELSTIKAHLIDSGLDTVDCTNDELVTTHLRFLAGGFRGSAIDGSRAAFCLIGLQIHTNEDLETLNAFMESLGTAYSFKSQDNHDVVKMLNWKHGLDNTVKAE